LKGLFWCIISSIIHFFTFHDVFSSSGIVVSSHDAIPRRSLSHYHSLYEDPGDWTPLVSAIRATPVYPRDGGLFFRDDQSHDIIPLQPLSVASTAPLTHLLGKKIIDGEAHRWTTAPFISLRVPRLSVRVDSIRAHAGGDPAQASQDI
jgi:hypothetical protein